MPFISSVQTPLLVQKILDTVPSIADPADATLIAQAICEWFEESALPTLIVPPVTVVTPSTPPSVIGITLPGTVE